MTGNFQVFSLGAPDHLKDHKQRKPHRKTKGGCSSCKVKKVKVGRVLAALYRGALTYDSATKPNQCVSDANVTHIRARTVHGLQRRRVHHSDHPDIGAPNRHCVGRSRLLYFLPLIRRAVLRRKHSYTTLSSTGPPSSFCQRSAYPPLSKPPFFICPPAARIFSALCWPSRQPIFAITPQTRPPTG